MESRGEREEQVRPVVAVVAGDEEACAGQWREHARRSEERVSRLRGSFSACVLSVSACVCACLRPSFTLWEREAHTRGRRGISDRSSVSLSRSHVQANTRLWLQPSPALQLVCQATADFWRQLMQPLAFYLFTRRTLRSSLAFRLPDARRDHVWSLACLLASHVKDLAA